MIKFPEQWHKVNKSLKFKKMVVTIGNVLIDIPLNLPIKYCQEYYLDQYYWDYGTAVLMETVND